MVTKLFEFLRKVFAKLCVKCVSAFEQTENELLTARPRFKKEKNPTNQPNKKNPLNLTLFATKNTEWFGLVIVSAESFRFLRGIHRQPEMQSMVLSVALHAVYFRCVVNGES